ncbi:MAG TPA: hypothetical protein VFY29_04550 [Terriglobia bacterium]|nr:hypothetical protein [Terriglobia bacterium]
MSRTDFFEVGDRTGLICAEPSVRDAVATAMRDLGFKFHAAETGETAIERMRYNRYDCIVIHESFAGSSLRTNSVLSYLRSLPMAQRRYSFVCLIGPSFKTLDAMQAFAESVHQVMNLADLPSLVAILKRGLMDFELRYRVYHEVVAAESER